MILITVITVDPDGGPFIKVGQNINENNYEITKILSTKNIKVAFRLILKLL